MANGFVQSIGDNGAAARRFSQFMESVLEAQTAVATMTSNDDGFTTTVDSSDGFTTTADSYTTSYSSRFTGTTFATQTYSSLNNVQQTSTPGNTETPLPYSQESDNDEDGLSTGQLVAAIVVPIVVTLLLALLAFLILLRRRRFQREQARPDSSSGLSKRGFFGIREKWSPRSSASSAASQKDGNPEITSPNNNSYMSGLATSSRSVSPQDDEQPPPYPIDMTVQTSMTNFSLSRPEMTQLHTPPQQADTMLSANSPVSPLSPTSNNLLSPNPSFLHARPGSSRSVNSDQYSETASIHSARAARMSVGGPTVMLRPGGNKSQGGSTGNPFDESTTSPVPSLPGRSRQDSVESKESDVSKELDV